MNDPWDVKNVRESGQYVSCIKISGVPLLPPVLSKECRKEMQYYKLLAKEVENRISVLKSFLYSEEDSEDEKDDAENENRAIENRIEIPENALKAGFGVNIEKITALTTSNTNEYTTENRISTRVNTSTCSNNLSITSNVVLKTTSPVVNLNLPKLVIDLSLSINETGKHILESLQKNNVGNQVIENLELPEHDYECEEVVGSKKDCTKPEPKLVECPKPQKELILNYERGYTPPKRGKVPDEKNNELPEKKWSSNSSFHSSTDNCKNDELDFEKRMSRSPSTCSKSLTGSLNGINTECDGNNDDEKPKLLRQHSYTILKPSPQLLAHLENHAYNTGLDISAISMSESISNLQSSNRKRRSWDLETAKEKWSSMAIELERGKAIPKKTNRANSPPIDAHSNKKNKLRQRSSSLAAENCVTKSASSKSPKVSHKENKQMSAKATPSSATVVKQTLAKKRVAPKSGSSSPKCRSPPEASDMNTAAKVRELYEKIQQQQMSQITSLIEKQKKEQMMMQQMAASAPFNSPPRSKDVTSEMSNETVDLSHVMSVNSENSLAETIAQTNNCISRCEIIMQKSKDIKSSITKHIALAQRAKQVQDVQARLEGSRTRTNSPRPGNFDSTSEYDPVLTDRTNDTLADLKNITFTSDSDDCLPRARTVHQRPASPSRRAPHDTHISNTETAITYLEQTIQNSIRSINKAKKGKSRQPSDKEQKAASTIAAFAKGYLTRRLMRTGRVQATVATIRDALECALALHRERDGIRGADVALHRRLIQQITAACYDLHETFVASTPSQRCAIIAADRARLRAIAAAGKTPQSPRARHKPRSRKMDVMSHSHSGAFPPRRRVLVPSLMTQSDYETRCRGAKSKPRYVPSPRHRASRPWR